MAGMETRGRRDQVEEAPDFHFVGGVAAIIVLALSLAIGIPVPSDVAMLVGP
jgi:hypothetical protein